jgi:hypothetical protein
MIVFTVLCLYSDTHSQQIPNPVQPTINVNVEDQDTAVFFQGMRAGYTNKKKSKKIYAFRISTGLFTEDKLGFEYRAIMVGKRDKEIMMSCTSMQDKDNPRKGCWAGDAGNKRALLRFSINLTGEQKDDFTVIYGGHWRDAGDMGPFTNGQLAGPAGRKPLQSIWVWVVPKEYLAQNQDMLQTIWESRQDKYDNVKRKFVE